MNIRYTERKFRSAPQLLAALIIFSTARHATAQLVEPDLFATADHTPWRTADAEAPPSGLSADDWTGIRAAYTAGRYAVADVGGTWRARNDAQQWTTTFDGQGFSTRPDAGGWQWGLALMSYGMGQRQQAVAHAPTVATEGGRFTYTWDARLQEWYVNDRNGLEHGFTLRERPTTSGLPEDRLNLTLAVRGELRPQVSADGRGLSFHAANGAPVVHYTKLMVQDADGRDLPAHFTVRGDRVHMVVDERGARYPITIDPLAQQAYLKASNSQASDKFGFSVAISGNTVVVGASNESSSATGVNGDQTNNDVFQSGAAYVFVREGGTWTQQAYLKASNTGEGDHFGAAVAIDGETIAVGAIMERSNAAGINGDQENNSLSGAGAVYVFVRNGDTWSQEAYIKPNNPDLGDFFGGALSIDDNTLVVGVPGEDGGGSGVNADQSVNNWTSAGAAYVFVRDGGTWSQQAYLKASNTGVNDNFGWNVGVSSETVVVGALFEDSNATGINGDQEDNSSSSAGAAYVFTRTGDTWAQQAYVKASNTGAEDGFGSGIGISGETLVVGARGESSNATGVNGDQSNNSITGSGAAYVFVRDGSTWSQQAYLKASNPGSGDAFGFALAIDGDDLVVGAVFEDSNATGVDGNGSDNSASGAGAAYVFRREGGTWSPQGYLKAASTDANDGFGAQVAISGGTVVIGAEGEDSNATGVNGDATNNSFASAGAAYIFVQDNSTAVAPPAEAMHAFSLYPNPVIHGVVSVGIPAGAGAVLMEVHDTSGRQVLATRFQALGSAGTPVDLSDLEPGGYAVMITVDGHRYTERLVIGR